MRRRYRRDLYADRVATIKSMMPHACIGVDVIVGFPAEDETRFENTYTFLSELPVSYLHVFTYSERPDTTAVDRLDIMGGPPIPKQERSRRNRMLRILSEKKRHAYYAAHQGEVRPVLWEGSEHDGLMHGYTDNYVRVQRPYDLAFEGQIEHVRLGSFAGDGSLVAEHAELLVI
jgi:threonylcarbamoyladenosine tRNA methylthiotransferase MtaB